MNVLIVGGGPIGLATAVQAKILNPSLQITFVDKHIEYKRTQRLRLDSSSFSHMPNNSELKEIIAGFKNKKLVPIQDIESSLKKLAEKIGIVFENYEFTDCDSLLKKYPATNVIVGADGAHSTVRKVAYSHEFKKFDTVQYLAQVQYTVRSKPSRLGGSAKLFNSSYAGTFVEESVNSVTNQVSLRFFIDKTTFEQVKDAKARNPWSLEDKRIPGVLKSKVYSWIQSRGLNNGETVHPSSAIELTAIKLDVYTAGNTVICRDGRVWCLVGDAAGGVPFFRSINKGFKESSHLARALAKGDAEIEEGKIPKHFKKYQSKARSIARWETSAAKVKSFFLNMASGTLKICKKVIPAVLLERLMSTQNRFRSEPGMVPHSTGADSKSSAAEFMQ